MTSLITQLTAKTSKHLLLAAALILFTPSFGAEREETPQDDDMLVEYYSIPAPDEILSYIHNNQIQFTPSTLTDLSKKNNYRTNSDKLLSFGFYLADMAYAITFDQSGTALDYFSTVEEMGKNLNIFPPEVEALGQRIMKNMNRMDSLNNLYDEVYLTIIGNLHETGRFGEYAMISAGGFIESLHLALNSNGTRITEDEFKLRIWEQKMIMDQLNKMLDKYLTGSTRTKMKADVSELTTAFDQYIQKNATTSSATRNDGAVLIGMPSPPQETAVQPILKIHQEVDALRARWIK
ncbi:hypothetical protein ACT3CD_14300 [Geofilum sp. OHC36d9]|uniref:hypothetical protein n=1 Tax=Geofilum sp. OHC36d9 TaxID=3458413 RepID=UPI004034DB59